MKIYIIYQEYELKRVPYKRELTDLSYVFQKSPYSMLLFWRYSKIWSITPIQNWTIYPPHYSILQAVNKMHCLYSNAVVQPSVQHYSCYMAWKTKVHTRCRDCHLCINAPMWREKKWLQGIFDPPSYGLESYSICLKRHFHLFINKKPGEIVIFKTFLAKNSILVYISLKIGNLDKIGDYDVIVTSYMRCCTFLVCMERVDS